MNKRPKKKTNIDAGEVELLRAHAFGKTREFLIAHPDYRPTTAQKKRLANFFARRTNNEPVALIIGRKGFFDIDLVVTRGVLIPRPETELLVESVLRMSTATNPGGREERMRLRKPEFSRVAPGAAQARESTQSTTAFAGIRPKGRTRAQTSIIDVGTGSGAIALTLAKHLPQARIIATDMSAKALALAKQNAKRLHLSRRITFVRANLLPKMGGKTPPLQPNIIVANLPYLPTRVWKKTMPDVQRFEPRTALDGGPDGLDPYRRLFAQIKHQSPHSLFPIPYSPTIIIEIDPSQKKILSAVVRRYFPKATVTFQKDLAGLWRICLIRI